MKTIDSLSQNQRRKEQRNPSKMFWDSSVLGTYVKQAPVAAR